MTITEEILMAFADGELDPAAQAEVEAAMREDLELQGRVARHRALRERLQAAYADELTEAVPQRLLTAVHGSAIIKPSNVIDLRDARAANARTAQSGISDGRTDGRRSLRVVSWRQWGSVAAGLVVGLGIGFGMWKQGEVPVVRELAGSLVADGRLARALSGQLSADQTNKSAVHIGVSYLSKSGEYCRSFTLEGQHSVSNAAASGIACNDLQHWQILGLTRDAPGGGGGYRTAATGVSPALLKIIEDQIQGEPLDAAHESAALKRSWQPAK